MPTRSDIRSAKTLSEKLENKNFYTVTDKTNPFYDYAEKYNKQITDLAKSETAESMKLNPVPPRDPKNNQTPKTRFVRIGGKRKTFRKRHNKSVKKNNKKTR